MSAPHGEHLPRNLWWVLIGITLVWGFNWTAMKVAIAEIAPFTFRTFCLAAGSGVLFAALRASGQPLAIPRDQWKRLVLIAFFTITCWNVLVVFGLRLIPSGRAAILAYTMPALAIPLSVWLLNERMSGRKLLGLAFGMAGMALLLFEEFANLAGAPLGALLVLGAASTWALGTVLQKKFPVRAPVAALMEVSLWPALAVAYNVLFSFAWAHWAWIKLATSVSVTTFSLAMLMTPVVGVFSGMLFLGERPGWLEFGALCLVLLSLSTVVIPVRK